LESASQYITKSASQYITKSASQYIMKSAPPIHYEVRAPIHYECLSLIPYPLSLIRYSLSLIPYPLSLIPIPYPSFLIHYPLSLIPYVAHQSTWEDAHWHPLSLWTTSRLQLFSIQTLFPKNFKDFLEMSEKSETLIDWAFADSASRLSVPCLVKICYNREPENRSFRFGKRTWSISHRDF
jgi:hypothetical protein